MIVEQCTQMHRHFTRPGYAVTAKAISDMALPLFYYPSFIVEVSPEV
jgi:hypothetical protein